MRQLNSLTEMAVVLAEREIAMLEALGHGLDKVLAKLQKTAESEFGDYQPAVGPFQAWPELADATKDERVRLGYTENDPLLRSGELRDSFSREREGLEGIMGSTDPRMVFHEFGTSRMPARPVLGPAGFRNKSTIQKLVGAAIVLGLVGDDQIHAALGYDFETSDTP